MADLYFLNPDEKKNRDKPPLISLKWLLIVLGTIFFVGGLVVWPALTWWNGRYRTLTILTAPNTTVTIGTPDKDNPNKLGKVLVKSEYDFDIRVTRGKYILVYKNLLATSSKTITVKDDATLATPILNSVLSKRPKNPSPWLASLDATLPSIITITDGYTIINERFYEGGRWYAVRLQGKPGGDTVKAILYHTPTGWRSIAYGQGFTTQTYPTVPAEIIESVANL